MKSNLKVWTGLGLATALVGAGLTGCAGESGENGEGGESAIAGEAGEGEGEDESAEEGDSVEFDNVLLVGDGDNIIESLNATSATLTLGDGNNNVSSATSGKTTLTLGDGANSVAVDADTAIVSWMESKDSRAQLKAIKITRSGKKSDYKIIAELDGSRKTGFPQMELAGDRVYFAWTDVAKGSSTIKTAYVPVVQF